ncbi:polyketide synthase, partial [Metarhizium brunneum ARSEF 3297]
MSGRLSSHASGTDGDGLMPIAVVGMSCRLSGIATSPEGLWQMLARGLTGWSSNGSSRFQMNSFWHPQSDLNASFNARGFHLIKQDPALFDNLFFGVTNIEARAIDPQQRMLLEVAYEAFETAGITMQNVKGSDTGVYCAVSHHDYDKILGRDPELSPGYRFTGTGPALVSNRISYVLDLHGPSITLDTACSGGLVAVHEACKAIRAGDVAQALVGGTNLILDPDQVNIISSMDFLSPHGRCYAFDSRADGFGRGEGVAAVVLKRLDMALGDGDPIRAVIRGSNVCSDGRTPGVTMPSSDIQRRMIQRAYQQAGLDPRDTTYVEAHAGTGTKAGDKAEATALHETFCKARQEGNRLFVGSVKGNVGHTESVAGLAGLIKTVLMLEKKMIPPNATFMKPNSDIPLESWGMEVPKRMLQWPDNATRRASVNSFGYGGTNAHVILDAADDYLDNMKHMCPPVAIRACEGKVNGDLAHEVAEVTETSSLAMTIIVSNPTEAEPTTTHVHGHSTLQHRRSLKASPTNAMTRPRLFPLSHDQEGGVAKLAANFKRFILDKLPDTNESLDSLAFTLSDRRSVHRFRWCVAASSRDELVDGLEHIVEGTDRALQQAEERKICFAFTGQGAQWAGMGRELLAAYPVFAKSMERSEKYLTHLGADWRLLAELDKPWETSRINEAALSQPCCTAIQIGLVDLLETWGIRPALVCGHSSGEIAAAYAAGIMTAQDCLKVAYFRGHLVKRLKEKKPELSGGMLAVGLSVGEAQKYLDNDATCEKVVVACVNSPASITLSGDEAVLSSIQETLAARGVFNRKLAVDVAYHSHHMNMILEEYLHAIQDIKPLHCGQHVQMVSSVTGRAVQGEELNATYWGRNLTSPVLFADALAEIFDTARKNEKRSNMLAVVEVGPHSALQGPIKQTIKASKTAGSISYHSVLSRKQDASRTAVALAASLFVNGATVDFGRVNDPHGDAKKNVLTNLPTYNWHHNTTHWVESRRSAQYRHRKFPKHDLVGVPSSDSIPSEPTWRNYIRLRELPWLKGHCIGGNTIFPAAGYVTMVLEALKQQILGGGNPWKKMRIKFRQVHFGRALLVADDSVGVETFVTIRPFTYTARESSASWNEFRIFSVSVNGESTEHSRGLVTAISPLPNQDHENMTDAESLAFIEQVSEKARIVLPPKQLYKELRDVGIEYSHPFNGQEHIRASESASTCRIKIPDIEALMPLHYQQPHCIHPATLDVCFQAAFSAMKVGDNLRGTFVLGGFDDLEISSEIPSQPGKHMSVAASLRGLGHSNFASDSVISSSDDGKSEVFIKIKGLILARTSGPSRQTSSQHLAGESLCHRLEWSLDPTCAEPHSIIKRCLLDPDVLVAGRTSMCEQYCQAVVAGALTELSPDDEAKITGHFSQWLLWMKSIRAGSYQPLQMGNALNDKIKSLGIYGEVLVDMAPRLVGILRGDVDPQALLLEKQRLYRLYTRDNIKRCHMQLAEYVKLLRFKTPNLRILEIGAATADGSMPVLEALYSNKGVAGEARSESYTLACAPTAFFQDAETGWDKAQESLEWKRLDMEISPKEQGFELGSYDLVIAANVLHATREINVALGNMRSLLKSNGKLAVMETTAPKIHDGVIFGMLPGWWLGATDGRVHSPLLDASGWRDRLGHCGFSGIDFEMHDFDSAEDHQVSVMVSSATSHPEPWCLGMQDPTRGVSTLESELPISKYPTNLTGSEGGPRQTILVISDGKESRLADHVAELLTSVESSVHAEKTMLAEAQVSPGQLAVVLLEAVHPFLATCSQADWGKVRHILSNADGVLWVSCGGAVEGTNPLQSLIVGLTRCLRSEDQHRKVVTLDLEPNHGSGLETAEQIRRVYHHVFGPHGPPASALPEFEYAIRNGEILIPRLMCNSPVNEYVQDSVSSYHPRHEQGMKPGRALSLKIHEPGLLNTLYWADSERHARSVGAEEVRVDLQYVSLNFKDIMIAMGQLEGHTAMLLEGSGKVVEVGEALRHQYSVGDLVFATDPDGVATTSVINKCNVHHIPRKLSMEVATAISLAYATALYSLRNVANLQEGESILIHSGAGAVGQAAISLAQYLNAGEIYVTVGSADKRALIRERFDIPDDKIFSSRGLSFYHQILRRTNGDGVDVILNSLSGEALQKSCSLLAPFGRFVEIGKKDVISNARLEMASLESNATFTTVDLTLLAKRKPLVHQELYRTIFELVGQDRIKVLSPITVSPVSELETSFRLMQAGKHVGKLLLQLDPDMAISVQPPRPPTPRLKGDCSYLVVGGTGGLGRATMKHFASLGAKHIFTLSRSGSDSPIMRELVEEMRLAGVCVVVFKGSVTDTVAIESIKEQAREFPIRGVVQGAMVLQDSRVDNMSYEQWRAAMEPKVVGTMNLHRVFGDTLDFFILLSSSAGIIGSYAQGNYSAGNTFQDSLARHRASLGLPARSIDVGSVEGEGYTANNEAAAEFVSRQGLQPYKVKEFLATINEAIWNPFPSGPSAAQLICGTRRADPSSQAKEAALQRPDPKFSHIWTKPHRQASAKADSSHFNIQAMFESAKTADEAEKAMQIAIKQKLAHLLGLPEKDVSTNRSVVSYGVDSLIAVELRNWILSQLESHVQIFELMSPMSFAELANTVARRSRLVATGLFGHVKV